MTLDTGGCPQFSHLAVSQLIFIFINTENPIKMLKKHMADKPITHYKCEAIYKRRTLF